MGLSKRTLIIVVVVAAVALIYFMGSEQRQSSGSSGSGDSAGSACQMTVTADTLNVRAEPDPKARVVDTLAQQAKTGAQTEVRNGFRKLDDKKWAANDFLSPAEGASC